MMVQWLNFPRGYNNIRLIWVENSTKRRGKIQPPMQPGWNSWRSVPNFTTVKCCQYCQGTIMSRVGQYQGSTEKYNLGWILPITGRYHDDTSGGNLVMLPDCVLVPGFMHSSTGITAPAQCCWYQVGRSMVPGCTFIHSLLSAPLILLLALLYLSLRIL